MYAYGDRSQPTAIVAVQRAELWADVIVLRGHDRAAAYRAPLRPTDNPLRARWVVWHYIADAVWTLRAALTITPEALSEYPYPLPDACRPPDDSQRPMTIRPGGALASRSNRF